MVRTNTYFQMRLTEDDKEYIKNKSEELGYKNVSAFLIDSAKRILNLKLIWKLIGFN